VSNPLRNKDPELFRLITLRTEGAFLRLRPSKDVNKVLAGVLARYAELFHIELFAYNFLSNHYHFLIRAPLSNTDEFLENLNREIARRLNWKLHRSGTFWGRRYSEQIVPTEADLLNAFLYVTTNATRHGLVADPAQWPGVSSYQQSLTEKAATYPFYHYSAEREEDRVTYHKIKLTPLPQLRELSKEERVEKTLELINERRDQYIEDRKAEGGGFLGTERVKTQDPNSQPYSVSKSPRPPCYTQCVETLREFKKQERLRYDAYHDCSMRFRLGELTIEFPEFCYRPPLHRKPRILPFTPLPDDYFKKAA